MHMAQFDANYTYSEITTMDITDNKFLDDDGNFYAIDDAINIRSNGN